MNIWKRGSGSGVSIAFDEVKERPYLIVKNVQEAKAAISKRTDPRECYTKRTIDVSWPYVLATIIFTSIGQLLIKWLPGHSGPLPSVVI
jgi:hypothetical protein